MKNMTLANIAACCGGTYIGDENIKNTEVTGIAIDSRKVKRGGLFIPIKGERVDGHDFIPAVIKDGALATLSEKELDAPEFPYILVESTLDALKKIAAFYRQTLGIKVVGITGSVGKTSTKEMIASVLKEKFSVHKTAGNFNNEIGLPLTIFDITEQHEIAVLEMGISDFGEMHRLAEIANPDICVITNIGLCHLENLGSRDGILKAKTEVFDHLRGEGIVILNGDDDKLSTITSVHGRKPVFYGREHGDVYATDITTLGMEGIRMVLHLHEQSREVTIPIAGEHNVYNALAAACVGDACGMDIDMICKGIATVETISGRSNLIEKNGVTIIDDCYNANPISMRASIDVLSQAAGRKIAVLGDMGELGTDEKELHANVGSYVAEKQIDKLCCTGELSKELAQAAKDAGAKEVCYFSTKEDLVEALKKDIKKGDTLLVKASHFMQFPKIVEALTAFLAS